MDAGAVSSGSCGDRRATIDGVDELDVYPVRALNLLPRQSCTCENFVVGLVFDDAEEDATAEGPRASAPADLLLDLVESAN